MSPPQNISVEFINVPTILVDVRTVLNREYQSEIDRIIGDHSDRKKFLPYSRLIGCAIGYNTTPPSSIIWYLRLR